MKKNSITIRDIKKSFYFISQYKKFNIFFKSVLKKNIKFFKSLIFFKFLKKFLFLRLYFRKKNLKSIHLKKKIKFFI